MAVVITQRHSPKPDPHRLPARGLPAEARGVNGKARGGESEETKDREQAKRSLIYSSSYCRP